MRRCRRADCACADVSSRETITVTWAENINHTGHFRIAFQPNGETFGIPPASAGQCVGPGTAQCPPDVTNCNFPTASEEGPGPAGSIVLKDRIPDGTLSTTVTLPNMECANCTLQFIQLMTDKCPYTVTPSSDDIYFNCADITLSNTAPAVDAGVPTGDAGGNNNGSGDASGGCSSTGGVGGFGIGFALLGLVWRRRRA
ncbi:MAG: SCE4755 family polysaccharide monooxygenase-like protein [Kofleriaceae bacterium]